MNNRGTGLLPVPSGLSALISQHQAASDILSAAYELQSAKELAFWKSALSDPIPYETSVGAFVLHSADDQDIIVSETACKKAPKRIVKAHELRSAKVRKKYAAEDNRNGLRWSTKASRDDYHTNVEPIFLADLRARAEALERWEERRQLMGLAAASETAVVADKAEQDAMDALAFYPCNSQEEARRKLDYLVQSEFEYRLDDYDDERRIAVLYALCGGRAEV